MGGGSWGTGRGTLAGNSGLLGGAWGLYARVSGQTTDGFREHSGVDQGTLYYGATRSGARSLFKLFGFSGREHTQLAYLATDEATLETDLRANALSPEETDRFGQDFVQAQYTHLAGDATTLTAQAYYNGAQGWFRIWDGGRESLQQYGIDGHFVGLVLGATHHRGRLGLNWGGHVNDFTRDHFMDVVGGSRAYLNTGLKNEYNTFLKTTWDAGRWRLWVDAQVRGARFEYEGDEPLGSVSWTFFNPKAGVRFDPTPALGLYASVGRMGREPARSDMLNGEDNASRAATTCRPSSRSRWSTTRRGSSCAAAASRPAPTSTRWSSRTRSRSPASCRRSACPCAATRAAATGAGSSSTWLFTPSPRWRLAATAALSRNRIDSWTQFYDVYDAEGAWVETTSVVHPDVAPLLTPARARERYGRVEADARGRPARGRPLRRRGAARQHRQPGLPHAVVLHPRPAGAASRSSAG